MRILSTAASGVRAQQLTLDNIADNLANINTTGYKGQEVDFAEALAVTKQVTDNFSEQNRGQVDIGAGVIPRTTFINQEQGAIIETGIPLDLAIEGKGFFPVVTSSGESAYTRDGKFRLEYTTDNNGNKLGRLVNEQGNILKMQPELNLPDGVTDLIVRQDGSILGKDKNGQIHTYGQIKLAYIDNPEGLLSIGDNLFQTSANSGKVMLNVPGKGEMGIIRSSALEQSNVDLTKAMNGLIQAQRAYQMNVRMIQDGDQMWGIANAIRR